MNRTKQTQIRYFVAIAALVLCWSGGSASAQNKRQMQKLTDAAVNAMGTHDYRGGTHPFYYHHKWHSTSVAAIARKFVELAGGTPEEIHAIGIAGLLHDHEQLYNHNLTHQRADKGKYLDQAKLSRAQQQNELKSFNYLKKLALETGGMSNKLIERTGRAIVDGTMVVGFDPEANPILARIGNDSDDPLVQALAFADLETFFNDIMNMRKEAYEIFLEDNPGYQHFLMMAKKNPRHKMVEKYGEYYAKKYISHIGAQGQLIRSEHQRVADLLQSRSTPPKVKNALKNIVENTRLPREWSDFQHAILRQYLDNTPNILDASFQKNLGLWVPGLEGLHPSTEGLFKGTERDLRKIK